MRTITIYRNGSALAEVFPDENAVQTRVQQGDDTLTLSFSASTYWDFRYNDSCTVFDKLYKINVVPIVKKGSGANEYTLTFHAEYYDLTKVQYLFLGVDNTFTDTEFDFNGTASDFLDLVLRNANRVSPQWKRGDVIDTGYKSLSFKNESCLDVLPRLAAEFNTEWWVEGKTIHLAKRRRASNMRFSVGWNEGLYSITRTPVQGAKLITRLYAKGANKNLPVGYRNGQQRLTMTGGVPYVEENVNVWGVWEGSATYDDIFPHRTGVVSSVGNEFEFFDNSLNFDINQCLIAGIPAKVTFNSGLLSGYTFAIQSFNPTTRGFVILQNTEEKTIVVPGPVLKPAIGDKYVLTDIMMPQPYITAAESQVTAAALNEVAKSSRPAYTYGIDISPTYMTGRNYALDIGYEVRIKDVELNVDERISVTKCTRSLKDENKYVVELAREKQIGFLEGIQNSLAANSRAISQVARAVVGANVTIGRIGDVISPMIPVILTGAIP
jgi:hypothetical protein